MQRLVMILFLSTIWFGSSFAQSFPVFPVGEAFLFPDARTLGLAGAGSVSNSGPGALLLNPAAMSEARPGLTIHLSAVTRNLEERRSFPVFDRFGEFNTYGIYVINNHWYNRVQGGVQYQFKSAPLSLLKTFALGIYQELDQDYLYEEEVRENVFPDDPLAINRIEYRGLLNRISAGVALELAGNLRAGLQLGILIGDLDSERAVTFINNSEQNQFEATNRQLDNTPIVASAGLTYQVNPYLKLGSHLRLPYSLDYQVRSQAPVATGETIEYPLQWTGGLEYRGRQALQARLNVDVTYEWWSKRDIFRAGQAQGMNYDDVVQIRTGIEHIFFDQVPFRVGLQYRTTPEDRGDARLIFTAGTGFYGKIWEVDLAGGFSKFNYSFPDLFDDALFGGDRSNSNIDDVQERYFFGQATLKVKLR